MVMVITTGGGIRQRWHGWARRGLHRSSGSCGVLEYQIGGCDFDITSFSANGTERAPRGRARGSSHVHVIPASHVDVRVRDQRGIVVRNGGRRRRRQDCAFGDGLDCCLVVRRVRAVIPGGLQSALANSPLWQL